MVLTIASAVFALFFSASLSVFVRAILEAKLVQGLPFDPSFIWPLMVLSVVPPWFALTYSFWLWHVRECVLSLRIGEAPELVARIVIDWRSFLVVSFIIFFAGANYVGSWFFIINPPLINYLPVILLSAWYLAMVATGVSLLSE